MKISNPFMILISLATAHDTSSAFPTFQPSGAAGRAPHPTGDHHPPFPPNGINITFPPGTNITFPPGTNITFPHPPPPSQHQQLYRGFSLSAWKGGQTQPVKQPSDWVDAFNRIRNTPGGFNAARTYATQDTNPSSGVQSKALLDILAGANETGVHVLVGLYLGENDGGKRFEQEFEVLKEGVEAWGFEHVIGITVGNEDRYRNTAPPALIAAEIAQVQQWLDKEHPDVCVGVGHVDTWTEIVKDTNKPITDAADFLVANIFPYWENSTIDTAKEYFNVAAQKITDFETKEDIEVWIGETGWPFLAGPAVLPGVVGKENIQRYWNDVVCSEAYQVRNSFYYIDCDQGDMPEWGVWGLDGSPRIGFECGPV